MLHLCPDCLEVHDDHAICPNATCSYCDGRGVIEHDLGPDEGIAESECRYCWGDGIYITPMPLATRLLSDHDPID